jgi:hypothetical protein
MLPRTIARLLLVAIPLSALTFPVQGDPTRNYEGFIYPPASNLSDTNVFNLTVHKNDSIVLEYVLSPYTTLIQIAFIWANESDIDWTASGMKQGSPLAWGGTIPALCK